MHSILGHLGGSVTFTHLQISSSIGVALSLSLLAEVPGTPGPEGSARLRTRWSYPAACSLELSHVCIAFVHCYARLRMFGFTTCQKCFLATSRGFSAELAPAKANAEEADRRGGKVAVGQPSEGSKKPSELMVVTRSGPQYSLAGG